MSSIIPFSVIRWFSTVSTHPLLDAGKINKDTFLKGWRNNFKDHRKRFGNRNIFDSSAASRKPGSQNYCLHRIKQKFNLNFLLTKRKPNFVKNSRRSERLGVQTEGTNVFKALQKDYPLWQSTKMKMKNVLSVSLIERAFRRKNVFIFIRRTYLRPFKNLSKERRKMFRRICRNLRRYS